MSRPLIRQFELTDMANFNYFIGDADSKKVAVVDPCDKTDFLKRSAAKENLQIVAILLTHGHYDHVGGVNALSDEFGIPVYLSENETLQYTPKCQRLIRTKDQEKIMIGAVEIKCIHTPGHTPGGQCFYTEGHLITGDTLFVDAVGRIDLPGGNGAQLFHSLQKINQLPRSTEIWCGHNYGFAPHATLDVVRVKNPFLSCQSEDEFLNFF